jgi:hypothetical protein
MEFEVIAISGDQLTLSNGQEKIFRFFWEVRSIINEKKEED